MNVVFFGSSIYSTIDEKALHEAFGLKLVVTLPDRQSPKTKEVFSNPVKKYALQNNIPVITTEKITPEIVEQVASVSPDFLVVADFGLILPKSLLDIPKKAPINVHHSLLPKYRGPAPVPAAILAGEKVLGVTIMLMITKFDAGDMLAQATYTLGKEDTSDAVLTKLNELGGKLVVEVIKDFDTFFKKRVPQDESIATYSQFTTSSHFMSKQDSYVDLQNPPSLERLNRMIHAYFPWPGAWTTTMINGKRLRIKLLPGEMVQVEGKKPMSYKDFINGYKEGKKILEKLQILD